MRIQRVEDKKNDANYVGELIQAALGPMAETLTGLGPNKLTKQA